MGKLSRKEINKLLDEASSLLDENLSSKEYKKALSIYMKVLKRKLSKSDRLLATEHKGIAFWGLGDKARKNAEKRRFYRQALKCFEEVIRDGGKSPHVKHCKKNKWYMLDSLEEFIPEYYRYLDLVLKGDQNNYNALWAKADVLMNQRNYAQAIKHWSRALKSHHCGVRERCPGKYEILNNMGVCFMGLKRREKALQLFENAIKIRPSDFDALYNKALTLYRLKKYNSVMNTLLKIPNSKKIRKEDKIKAISLVSKCLIKMVDYVEPEKIMAKLDRNEYWKFRLS